MVEFKEAMDTVNVFIASLVDGGRLLVVRGGKEEQKNIYLIVVFCFL